MNDPVKTCHACSCTSPGWCERHGKEKTPEQFAQCQVDERLRSYLDFRKRVSDDVMMPDPLTYLNGRELKRYKHCLACPEGAFEQDSRQHKYFFCVLLDDNGTDLHNCEQSKSARYKSRLTSSTKLCRYWS